mmetsp:Transcript_31059/g.71580  ORF Transcript_31059/g.71580 Transcript_31059/m.71580 type:complete len:171 (-) Transcript_31059:421-933(-)
MPSWNAITKAFRGNPDVSFGDVNLSEQSIRGPPHNPGSGGWPTIRYFNAKTGPDGGNYVQRTEERICKELGDRDFMIDYIEQYGNTVLCGVDGRNCNEKELKFLGKVKAYSEADLEKELTRLDEMETKGMKKSLKDWILRRRRILRKLLASSDPAAEASESESEDTKDEL